MTDREAIPARRETGADEGPFGGDAVDAQALRLQGLPDPAPFTTADPDMPDEGIGICLSGGGYRAMLFHLGALRRLLEEGILQRASRISSVSGGSITAAVLGLAWKRIRPDLATSRVVPDSFVEHVEAPLRRLASTTVDLVPSLLNAAMIGNAASRIARRYNATLFHGATLQDLPDDGAPMTDPAHGPRFMINATNLESGVLWRFSRKYMADWTVGLVPRPNVPLASAVAASSAFPLFLSPLTLSLQEFTFEDEPGKPLPINASRREQAVLTDGGVYDNLGLETVWKNHRTVFVSDAGGGAEFWDRRARRNWLRQISRVFWVQRQQVGGLRRRQLMASYRPTTDPGSPDDPWWRHGAFWSIAMPISRYGHGGEPLVPDAEALELAATPVRLKAMSKDLQDKLIRWGYAACDASLRRWYDVTIPPQMRQSGAEPKEVIS